MDKKYTISPHTNPTMNLRDLSYQLANNEATLRWEWPLDRDIRFAVVFKCLEDNPTLGQLMATGQSHEIVVRDLSSSYTVPLQEERCKFLICPAYFDENKTIAICPTPLITEWIYKKSGVTTTVVYTPIKLSQYHKATITIAPHSAEQQALLTRVLSYHIVEPGASTAIYPIDMGLISHGGHVYIKKGQRIKFALHQGYAHLFELKEISK